MEPGRLSPAALADGVGQVEPAAAARGADGERVATRGEPTPRVPEPERSDDAPQPEFPRRSLAMRMDHELGRVVVKVLDAATGEVVRQIPPEEWVRIQKGLAEARGLLVDREG